MAEIILNIVIEVSQIQSYSMEGTKKILNNLKQEIWTAGNLPWDQIDQDYSVHVLHNHLKLIDIN
jgi:hypothetical protein